MEKFQLVLLLKIVLFALGCGKTNDRPSPIVQAQPDNDTTNNSENLSETSSETDLKEKNSDKKPSIPVALETSSFKFPKFDSVDWSGKCESIKSYLESYVDTYLFDDVSISFESQCIDSAWGEGMKYYYLRTLLTKENFQLELFINIYASKTKSEGSLYKIVDSREIVNFDTEANMFGEDIKNISATFDSWLNGNEEATVFGQKFDLFTQRVFELGSDKDGMYVEAFDNANISIRLSSTDAIREIGIFEILSIDDSVYSVSEDNDFLGCRVDEGLDCLNNRSLEYTIVGNQLQLQFPPAPGQPLVTVVFGVTFDTFP